MTPHPQCYSPSFSVQGSNSGFWEVDVCLLQPLTNYCVPLRSCWICSYSTRQNQSFMRKRLNCDMSICKWHKNSRGHSSGYLNVEIKDYSYIWLYIDWLVGVERQLSNIDFSYIVAFCLYSISTRSCMATVKFHFYMFATK